MPLRPGLRGWSSLPGRPRCGVSLRRRALGTSAFHAESTSQPAEPVPVAPGGRPAGERGAIGLGLREHACRGRQGRSRGGRSGEKTARPLRQRRQKGLGLRHPYPLTSLCVWTSASRPNGLPPKEGSRRIGERPSDCREVAPGGVEPPRTDSKSVALSAELRGLAQQRSGGHGQIESVLARSSAPPLRQAGERYATGSWS